MESVNNTSMDCTTLLEEKEATLSNFRKRNKILIRILLCLIITFLALIVSAFIYLFPQTSESIDEDPSSPLNLKNPALESFCSVTSNASFCYRSLQPNTDLQKFPDQVLSLYLTLSVDQIKNVTTLFLARENTSPIQKCSVSLGDSLSQLTRASTEMRAIHRTEIDERIREIIMNWLIAALDHLASCLDHLVNAEKSTAPVHEVRDKGSGVKNYVGFCVDYLMHYGLVLDRFDDLAGADFSANYNVLENLLGTRTFLFGLQYLFLLFLFGSLCQIHRC